MKNPFKTYEELWVHCSGNYLTESTPLELYEGDEETLLKFIKENPWEPFENYNESYILEQITSCADSLVSTFKLKFKE